ncbi:hypothetical protein GEMRC1_007823 [Eukaryota sp. GEM-RC1]
MSSFNDPNSFLCNIHGGLLLDPYVISVCGHSFCRKCITEWVKLTPSCPLCRSPLTEQHLSPNRRLQAVMDLTLLPKILSLSDLRDLTPLAHNSGTMIGTATFGGQPIILEQPGFTQLNNQDDVSQALIRIYQTYKAIECSSTVLTIFGVTLDPPGIIKERLSCSLQQLLDDDVSLNVNEASIIAEDIALALCSFHRAGYVHGDVSAQNIILKNKFHTVVAAKLTGFDGFRTHDFWFSPSSSGSIAYVAPEVLMGQCTKFSGKSDIHAFGVVLWSIFSDRDPTKIAPNVTQLQIQRLNHQGRAAIDLDFLPDLGLLREPLISLISSMISKDPESRPSIEDVLSQLETLNDLPRPEESSVNCDMVSNSDSLLHNKLKTPVRVLSEENDGTTLSSIEEMMNTRKSSQPIQRESDENRPLTIVIRCLSGRDYSLAVQSHDTIEVVNDMICQESGLPVDVQRLIFNKKQLKGSQILQDCGVKDKSVLHLIIRHSNRCIITIHKQDGNKFTVNIGEFGVTVADIKAEIYLHEKILPSFQCLKDGDGVILPNHFYVNINVIYTPDGEAVNQSNGKKVKDFVRTDELYLEVNYRQDVA